MKYVTNYTFKPYMTKEDTAKLIETFATFGEAPGATTHLVWTDGRGGTVIGETDDIEAVYRNLLNYTDWMQFESHVALTADDAVAQVMDYLG